MPTISVFFGFIIRMYWLDHNPPHVHVWYQGQEALVAIETGDVLAGHLPRASVQIIRDWIRVHQAELMANWERGRRREEFQQVPGADAE